MSISITIPDPSTFRVGKEGYVDLASGTDLHRIHPAKYSADQFNPTDSGDARFSPIRDARRDIIPTIYAAQTFDCATCEIILRCPDTPPVDPKTSLPTFQIVNPSDFKDYSHSTLKTTAGLKLVDLTNFGQRKIGVDHNALLAGPRSTYWMTRAWAECIHTKCPNAQGIYYTSYQCGQVAIVLFGDRVKSGVLKPGHTRSVADFRCHVDIQTVANSLSIEYEDV